MNANVRILREAGYEEAMLGLSLSHDQSIDAMPAVALQLHDKDGGHNKFLESICVWLDITMPRYWWQQFDTYRLMTKQSGSTMHTILKRPLVQDDFVQPITIATLIRLNNLIERKAFEQIKVELPEGFLQRRIPRTDYKTLRNIIRQRKHHKLLEWRFFCTAIIDQLERPELL